MINSTLRSELLAQVDKRADELIQLAAHLIQIPSENPPGNSGAIADAISAYLVRQGIASEELVAPGGHVNLLARLETERPGKRLIFCGHTDVVPAGDRSRWDFSPESGEVRDGYLLGRGASDMKAGLAGLMLAMAILKQHRDKFSGEIVLAAADDEETGGEFGVEWLLAEGHLRGNACLIAEPSSALYPTIGQKGSAWTRLIFRGQPTHGSLAPIEGDSATLKAAKATVALQRLFEMPVAFPEDLRSVLEVSQEYIRRNRANPRTAEILDHVSVNVGVLRGGSKANIVADQCVLETDIRVPFGATPEQVAAHIDKLLAEVGLKRGVDYEAERMAFHGPANYTLPSEPIVQAVLRSIELVRGERADGVLQWASSDARYFRRFDIPVLQYGPADLPTIHGLNEKVLVEEIVAAAKVYVLTAVDYLTEGK
jgi:succinyl-diaminopimelate desuccinylase